MTKNHLQNSSPDAREYYQCDNARARILQVAQKEGNMSYTPINGFHSQGYKSDSLEGFLSSGSESSLEEIMETEEKSQYDDDDYQIDNFEI